MIFISHDLAVVREIAHRILVLYLGRVVELGDRDAVCTEPRHPYTQALLSAVPLPDRSGSARGPGSSFTTSTLRRWIPGPCCGSCRRALRWGTSTTFRAFWKWSPVIT